MLFFNFRKTGTLCISQHRNDKSALARNRDADVEIIAINNVIAANLRVELWKLFQRINRGLQKNDISPSFTW